MIEESARVVTVEAGFAWVETRRGGACGACGARAGCGTATLERYLGRRRTRVRAVDEVGVRPGDEVVVGLPEGALVKGSLAVYLVPLLGLFGAGAVAETLSVAAGWETELPVLVGALAGGGAALAWVRAFSRRIAADTEYHPAVLRRVTTTPRASFPVRIQERV